MPGGDRTGPRGMGPLTGRGAGYCAGARSPGYATPGPGRGLGVGRGRGGGGRGWRHWYYATGLPGWARFGSAPGWGSPQDWADAPQTAPPTQEQEARSLKAQADALKQQLDTISRRIAELEQKE